MHPITLLLKTTAKTLPLIGSIGAGSKPMFNSTDAAWTLAGLPTHTLNFAYWRYCGEESKESEVIEQVVLIAGQMAIDKKLRLKEKTICSLAESAIKQYKRPSCAVCNGHGIINDSCGSPTVCKVCKGHGKKILNKSQLAAAAGVNRRAITDNHLSLVADINNMLVQWERLVVSHVAKRME